MHNGIRRRWYGRRISIRANLSFWSDFFRESNGKCMFATRDFFINVNTGGKDLQIGAGGAGVGGPLMLIK
jgi:hypothetical protein